VSLDKLTKGRIVSWHQKIAETPPRLRTKPGMTQRHREADGSVEGVRRRRSTANRVLTILKAALNHAHREGRCVSDDAWRTVRAFREADAARLRYLSDDEARRLTNACRNADLQFSMSATRIARITFISRRSSSRWRRWPCRFGLRGRTAAAR